MICNSIRADTVRVRLSDEVVDMLMTIKREYQVPYGLWYIVNTLLLNCDHHDLTKEIYRVDLHTGPHEYASFSAHVDDVRATRQIRISNGCYSMLFSMRRDLEKMGFMASFDSIIRWALRQNGYRFDL